MTTAVCGGLVAPANTPEQKNPLVPTATAGAQGCSPDEQDAMAPIGSGAACGASRSVLLAFWLLAGGWQPRLTVEQLRRKCRYAGLNMTLTGRPIRLARRHELIALLSRSTGDGPAGGC